MTHPLTAIRKKRGLTKQQLAEAAGLDRSTVSKIESGTRGSLWSYRRLGMVLAVDYRKLMPDLDPASQPPRVDMSEYPRGGRRPTVAASTELPQMVRQFREKLGLSVASFAAAAGLNDATVRRIESGGAPSRKTVGRLALAMRLDYRRLMPAEK